MKSAVPDTSTGFVVANPGSKLRTEFERLHRAACRDCARSCLAVNVKDGSILTRIPAGEFEMGDGKETRCPKHRVELSEYWIGIYCITNRQYGKFVAATKLRMPDNQRWQKSELAEHPVTDVSWYDCEAYARWAGLSLPSEAQWEKAARGPGGLIYPWGNEWDQNKCRNDKNKGSGTTAAVWDYPNGTSGYGTLQQSGNVWEWCADRWDEGYYRKSPPKDPGGPQTGSFQVYRGGGWDDDVASCFRGACRGGSPPAKTLRRGFRLVRNSP